MRQQRLDPMIPDIHHVVNFIRAMNVARRNLMAYPRGHTLVIESFEKVLSIIADFFQFTNHITFGVAKDALMLGTNILDKKNPLLQGFARILFEHGVVSLTFFRGLTAEELMDFSHIISQKRTDVHRLGGIATLLAQAKVHNITVHLIDYRMFQAHDGSVVPDTDPESSRESGFWYHFVRRLMEGTLDPQGIPDYGMEDFDPETLAKNLNEQYGWGAGPAEGSGVELSLEGATGIGAGSGEGPGGSMTAGAAGSSDDHGKDGFHKAGQGFDIFLDSRGFDFGQLIQDEASTSRLNRFIRSLDPRLRKAFVERFFSSFSNHAGVFNQVAPNLSDDIIFEALEKSSRKELYVPPNILDILKRLKNESEEEGSHENEEHLGKLSRDELMEKFSVIFKEDEVDRFVPLDYQQALHHVLVAETLSAPEVSQVHQLEETLSAHSINMNLTSVVVDILAKRSYQEEVSPCLIQSLKSCCRYLISVGDFHALSEIYKAVAPVTTSNTDDNVKATGILEVFSDDDFIGDVLDAPSRWGKEKDFYIVELIKKVGLPFIEPLLDRLASEEDRTLRYFYLDLLGELGPMAREHATRRLNDKRWFFVRNLIILLRNLNDPSVLSSLHSLLDHPHPRVRHELMQTLIKFNDPVAERIILQEMDSPDTGRCLKAIALAGTTRNKIVSQKLLTFLKQRGLGKAMLPIKKASVHALGEIGDPSVLPDLHRILKSRTFFRRHAAANLKLEIIESLGKYPAGEASSILRSIASTGPPLLVNRARKIMKTTEVGSS